MGEGAGRAGQAFDGEDLVALDLRLVEVDKWIDLAADALLDFRVGAGFRRSSISGHSEIGSTSTARSFFALHEYRRFLVEEARRDEEKAGRVDEALAELIRGWVLPAGAQDGLTKARSIDGDGPNLFTDCHLVTSMVLARNLASELGLGAEYERVAAGIDSGCTQLKDDLLGEMADKGELGVRKGEPGHHFITYYGVRAVDAWGGEARGLDADHLGQLAPAAENRALQQLAYHSAKVMARFDPARLAFAAALLGRLKVADWRQLSQHSIKVVIESQTEDGAWPTSQLVAFQSRSLLHVSSYELALVLACTSLRELAHGEIGMAKAVLPSLDRVMDLVRAGYVSNQDHGLHGWGNDRTRWEGLVESWATALVLTLLLRVRDVVLELRQELVLRRYRASEPSPSISLWPDLEGALFSTRGLDEKPLDDYFDPNSDRRLVTALQSEILEPVVSQMGQRPEKASLILYGDPGTRKTSLVKATAGALSWPLVTLSPPDFLGEGGLEGFEVSAARIFEDLMRLRRAVVLFDECEDFFKPRPVDDDEPEGDDDGKGGVEEGDGGHANGAGGRSERFLERPEARTIGAFLTAGMLPRLQALRNRRWVIFVLATNSKLSAIDKAVRRPGRFDFSECLMHPDLGSQKRYVENHRRRMDGMQRENVCLALDQVDTEDLGRKDKRVPFAVIDYVVNTIRDRRLEGTKEEAVELLIDRIRNIDKPPELSSKP